MKRVAERPGIGRTTLWHYSDVGGPQFGLAGTPGTP